MAADASMTDQVSPATILALNRTRLAYDRTMLAWVRTAIALITFGFSIQQFFRTTSAVGLRAKGLIGPHEFGMIMIIIGLLALLLAMLEHRSMISALKAQYLEQDGYPNIPHSQAARLAALIAILGLLALISAVFRE